MGAGASPEILKAEVLQGSCAYLEYYKLISLWLFEVLFAKRSLTWDWMVFSEARSSSATS